MSTLFVESYAHIMNKAEELKRDTIIIPHGSQLPTWHGNFAKMAVPTSGIGCLESESDRNKERQWLLGAGIHMPGKIETSHIMDLDGEYDGAKGGKVSSSQNLRGIFNELVDRTQNIRSGFITGTAHHLHYFYSNPKPRDILLSQEALNF